MSSQESSEQITLYTPDYQSQDDNIVFNAITHELLQTSNMKEIQKLIRIYDHRYLNINEKNSRKISSFNVRISMLDPAPVKKFLFAFKHFLLAVVFFVIAAGAYKLIGTNIPFIPSRYLTNPYMYSVIALASALGMFTVIMIKRSRKVLIFYSRNGRTPILELLLRNPDKRTFNNFILELISCIRSITSNSYYTDAQILAAELSEHRRLRDEGLIRNAAYEKAKNRLLNSHIAAR